MKYLTSNLVCDVLTVNFSTPTVLDSLAVKTVFEELDTAIETTEHKQVLLDFEFVSLMTSEMLGGLVRFQKQCEQRRLNFKLCNLNEGLIHLFEITKLQRLFDIHVTAEAAMESFSIDDFMSRQGFSNQRQPISTT